MIASILKIVASIIIILILILCFFFWVNPYAWGHPNETTALASAFAALGTVIAVIVFLWQGQTIKKQLELSTLVDLYQEWNSKEMLKKRALSFDTVDSGADLDKVEAVLEFLEKIASFHVGGILSEKLIWDTFGWYILRYYFYNKDKIKQIREKWGNDKTLYCDLKELYGRLSKKEVKLRKEIEDLEELEIQFSEQRQKFIDEEKKLYEEYGKDKE